MIDGNSTVHPLPKVAFKSRGIAVREQFAAMVLQGLVSNASMAVANPGQERALSELAVRYADALIVELAGAEPRPTQADQAEPLAETDEDRCYREMMDSDDPSIWTPRG